MRTVPTLLALFTLGLVNEASSLLRFSPLTEDPSKDKDLKQIGDEAKQIGTDFGKAVGDAAGKAKDKVAPKTKRKPMDPIENMRAMMCWGRKNLLEHEKCMKWMTKNCRKETTGDGYCKKLRRYVKSKCRKGSQKACDYAKRLGIDIATDTEQTDPDDMDGDGVKDKDDAFPDNPMESVDSDGDGVGDNSDRWPLDPTCSDEGDVCGGAAGPSPAPAASPAGAPSDGLSMNENIPLPSQGFSEHSKTYVAHDDGKTMTSDWRGEWPMSSGSEEQTIKSICDKNPGHVWCKLKHSQAARKAYATSHP